MKQVKKIRQLSKISKTIKQKGHSILPMYEVKEVSAGQITAGGIIKGIFNMTEQKNTCRGCGAEIEWIKMASGKLMPCNPAKVSVIMPDGIVATGLIPHWGTCPQAKKFKK